MSDFPSDYDDEGERALGNLGRTYEERLAHFMAKLRGRVADMAEEKRAHVAAERRLPLRKDEMLRQLSHRLVEKVFEKQADGGGGGGASAAMSSPGGAPTKLTPEQFKRALAHFRTPGQPLLSQDDIIRLWTDCARGDPKRFVARFFDGHPQHDEKRKSAHLNRELSGGDGAGKKAPTRGIKGMGEGDAVKLHYRYSKTLVSPPLGWGKREMARSVRHSFNAPDQALKLERVYGINLEAHGPNLLRAAGNRVLYAVAAICVVHELESGKQTFFHGHRDDITAVAVDREGKLAATGQVTSTTSPAFVCVWEVLTCVELLRIGDALPAAIERLVCATCFTDDATHLVTIGGDDRHSIKLWNLEDERVTTPVFEGQAQNGKPPAIWSVTPAPKATANAYGVDDFFVTAGENHVCFWGVARPKEKGQPYDVSPKKGTYGSTPPAKRTHAVAFVPNDDMVLSANETGHVYMWRDMECLRRFEAHRGACRALWSDEVG
jgi:hypothetical protein